MRVLIAALRTAAAPALAATVALSACSSASPSPSTSRAAGANETHKLKPGDHTVAATESGSGRSGSLTFTDPYASGSKLTKIEYHLHDGYSKRVIIPGGAFVLAEDIAICGSAGKRYLNIGFVGTGLPCHPVLHTVEVLYHQNVGDLIGRFRPHRNIEVTETAQGTGQYLTVGHIDHGAMLSIEYYWANGEHLTINLRGDVLVDHIRLITSGGQLEAAVVRHP